MFAAQRGKLSRAQPKPLGAKVRMVRPRIKVTKGDKSGLVGGTGLAVG
jgi:hypothetical protein